jgi:hypothetical protein
MRHSNRRRVAAAVAAAACRGRSRFHRSCAERRACLHSLSCGCGGRYGMSNKEAAGAGLVRSLGRCVCDTSADNILVSYNQRQRQLEGAPRRQPAP